MIEIFTSLGMGELGAYILSLGSPIVAILGVFAAVLVGIYKMSKAINEFRNTDEMKELISTIKTQNAENKALRQTNKKLIQALERKIDLGELGNGKED